LKVPIRLPVACKIEKDPYQTWQRS